MPETARSVVVWWCALLHVALFASFWIILDLRSTLLAGGAADLLFKRVLRVQRRDAPENNLNHTQLPEVLDEFCQNFNGDLTSPLYLNYTGGNVSVGAFSRVNLTLVASKFHFAVQSAASHFAAREAIRQTWAKVLSSPSVCGVSASLVFYVGKTGDPSVASLLERELQDHPDDMVLLDFCDAYENLSLKTYNTMRFVNDTFPNVEFIVKIDDDILPNVPLFLRCFADVEEPQFGVFGLVKADKPAQVLVGKHRIAPSRYRAATFPAFAYGGVYVVRRTDVPRLLDAAARIPALNLEDVWFNGLASTVAGVGRKNVAHFLNLDEKSISLRKGLKRNFFFHHAPRLELRRWWEKHPQSCDRSAAVSGRDFCSDFNVLHGY